MTASATVASREPMSTAVHPHLDRGRRTRLIAAALAVFAVALASAWIAAPAAAAPAGQASFATPLADPVRIQPQSTGPVDPGPGTAPWSVLINIDTGSSLDTCTGSIISTTEVLTAGHCAVDETSGVEFPTGDYLITAGTVTTLGSPPVSEEQRTVSAINVFPGYVNGDHGDDISMLTLSSPLVTTADVAPISMVGAGGEPAPGSAGVFYGWGETSPGASDGNEHYLPFSFESALACASGLPSVLCALSSSGDSCPGDSGSGLTTGSGSASVLVGVLDYAELPDGSTECTTGHYIGYTDLASPEIAAWLAGAAVALAPRTADAATLGGDENVGGTSTCAAPPWSDGANAGYVFFDAQSLAVLQSGTASSFPISQSLVGHEISCAAEATSAGGATYATASTDVTIAASLTPTLSLTITSAGRLGASGSTPGAVAQLTLSVTRVGASAGARPAFTVTFSDATPYANNLAGKFAAGSYNVCLSSPQSGIYAPASTCAAWVQNGTTAGLVSIKASSAGGRAVFQIRVQAPLLGRKVSVRWFAGSCCTRRDLITARSVRLRALTTIHERRRGHGRRFVLSFTLPTLAYRGATLRGGARVTFAFDYGGKATGWRKL
jgi:hypothetical protein